MNPYLVITDGEDTLTIDFRNPYADLMTRRPSERMAYLQRLQTVTQVITAAVDIQTWPCSSEEPHPPHLNEGTWCLGILDYHNEGDGRVDE